VAESAVNDELVGTTLGNCLIQALIGYGGMASVYRGRQTHLDREVAIKVLPAAYAADHAFVDRFKLEARATARLAHPNIITIHDAGEERGRLYIVMAYISGGTLKQRMGTAMDMRAVVRIIKDVASALSYAHERGIVHRDVKPVNVLMDADGRPILTDFGIAKVLTESEGLTRVGAGVGTPEYMSPEQCRGVAVDARADIYALGVVLYEMLTGRTPFVADNYTALAHAHIYEPVLPPSRLNPRVSPAVQSVVQKALAKDPAQRFQQATELALALEQAVEAQVPVTLAAGATSALPVGAAPPPGYRPQRPHPAQQTVYCPRCHSLNPVANRYCTRCGLPLVSMMVRCRQCGAGNARSQRYCTRCGQPLE
jgi:serine/threonine protein kinase